MTKLKSELIDSFLPNAVLVPLKNEAKKSIIDTKD
jgi:hypothetical protein